MVGSKPGIKQTQSLTPAGAGETATREPSGGQEAAVVTSRDHLGRLPVEKTTAGPKEGLVFSGTEKF